MHQLLFPIPGSAIFIGGSSVGFLLLIIVGAFTPLMNPYVIPAGRRNLPADEG